ncbi:MAG: FAD-dependent oxidoreductase [Opitutus sp.]|nr:FAD-dependent oxidoreductase [Opitutus sp.]
MKNLISFSASSRAVRCRLSRTFRRHLGTILLSCAVVTFDCRGLRAAEASADLVIYGGTPAGIVTAVRAAREGLSVVLVQYDRHLGGMPSNGLGLFDTLYTGQRAPLTEEVQSGMAKHYGTTSRKQGYEAHVIEALFERMVAKESRITIVRGYFPASAVRSGRLIKSVSFRKMDQDHVRIMTARAFVDASYEGDLAKIAGAEMITGREGRDQYGEPHAGVVFTKIEPTPPPPDDLKLVVFPLMANRLLPGSTGAADRAVQAYNFRVCLTRDPANRIAVQKPAHYERDIFLDLRSRWKFTSKLPNQKTSWNAPLLIGGNFDYPDGDWATRRAITERHRDLALGLLWFMQHDEAVPEATRAEAREWGLPKDEFTDNGNFPWQMYVREGRRLVGRHVFTQHDGMAAPGLKRAPIQFDSIAITEWVMDSHSCTTNSVPGSDHEGKVLLSLESRPGQIAYRDLLPKELDNLLVTGCVSSSHVGWGAIRLEPTWMHLAESAGYALVMALKQRVQPADISTDELLRTLVKKGVMITFFNDFDMSQPTPVQEAAQYLGTRGYFPAYDAKLEAPLSAAVAKIWASPARDPRETARLVAQAENAPFEAMTRADFGRLAGGGWKVDEANRLTRGEACAWLFSQRAR